MIFSIYVADYEMTTLLHACYKPKIEVILANFVDGQLNLTQFIYFSAIPASQHRL